MSWDKPVWLLALWLVPVIVSLYCWSNARIDALSKLLVDDTMARSLLPRKGRTRIFYKTVLLTSALTLLVCSLAGPRFGVYFEKVSRKGTDLLVLLDTSRSMLAQDVPPDRITSAKLDIEDLLEKIVGDRVGLIAFSGKPVIQIPLTNDMTFFRERLKEVNTSTAPRGGTAIGDAIRLGLRSLPEESERDKAMILISDGEDHDSMPLDAARDAAARGVRIYTVALGDLNEGARIPLFDKNGKRSGWEQYQGQEVWSKPDTNLLKEIATITGGTYIPAGTSSYDLGGMYLSQLEELKRGDYETGPKRVLHEQYQMFLFFGLVALLGFYVISPYRNAPAYLERLGYKSGMSTKTALIVLFFILPLTPSGIARAADDNAPALAGQSNENIVPPSANAEADPDAAAESAPVQDKTPVARSAKERYNHGCALTQQGMLEDAMHEFASLLTERNSDIVSRSHFNLGTLMSQRVMSEPGADSPVNAESQVPQEAEPQQESNLDKYRKESLARSEQYKKIEDAVTEASQHLQKAAQDSSLREAANQNLDVLRNWLASQKIKWQEEERHARAVLSLPEHLSWLEEEARSADQTLTDLPDEATADTYQTMHDNGYAVKNLTQDFHVLSDKISAALNNAAPLQDPNSENTEPTPEQKKAEEAMRNMIQGAEDKFARAAESFTHYNREDGIESLRKAVTEINAASSLMLPYPDLVHNAVAFQEAGIDKMSSENDTDSPLQNNNQRNKFIWDAESVRFWNRLIMQHAQSRLAELEDEDTPEILTDNENPSPAEPNAGPGQEVPEESTESMNQQEQGVKSPEDKILESMRLANELGPEIDSLLTEIPALLAAPSDSEKDKVLLSKENRVLELLREIAKPLQDEQQNNQNQDQQNQDQNQPNSDQNNQSQQNNNSQKENFDQQEQNTKDDEQQSEKQDNKEQPEDQQNESPEQEQQSAENKDEEKPSDKAEALMRQVRKRQQDAKETRDAVERFLRQNEKVEKNW
ncbi:MAG: VWA domain-containing protein [Planctomycetia bacterium]|nr:VWA domain-containing protein [Planctomycetia bacterium]